MREKSFLKRDYPIDFHRLHLERGLMQLLRRRFELDFHREDHWEQLEIPLTSTDNFSASKSSLFVAWRGSCVWPQVLSELAKNILFRLRPLSDCNSERHSGSVDWKGIDTTAKHMARGIYLNWFARGKMFFFEWHKWDSDILLCREGHRSHCHTNFCVAKKKCATKSPTNFLFHCAQKCTT